jgi:hypothetical protein
MMISAVFFFGTPDTVSLGNGVVFIMALDDTALSVAIELSLRGASRYLIRTICMTLRVDAAYSTTSR